jgi:hypothetical protein
MGLQVAAEMTIAGDAGAVAPASPGDKPLGAEPVECRVRPDPPPAAPKSNAADSSLARRTSSRPTTRSPRRRSTNARANSAGVRIGTGSDVLFGHASGHFGRLRAAQAEWVKLIVANRWR